MSMSSQDRENWWRRKETGGNLSNYRTWAQVNDIIERLQTLSFLIPAELHKSNGDKIYWNLFKVENESSKKYKSKSHFKLEGFHRLSDGGKTKEKKKQTPTSYIAESPYPSVVVHGIHIHLERCPKLHQSSTNTEWTGATEENKSFIHNPMWNHWYRKAIADAKRNKKTEISKRTPTSCASLAQTVAQCFFIHKVLNNRTKKQLEAVSRFLTIVRTSVFLALSESSRIKITLGSQFALRLSLPMMNPLWWT